MPNEMNQSDVFFEVFIIDFKRKAICPDATSLLHFIQACSSLWQAPTSVQPTNTASDGKLRVEVTDETNLGQPALSTSANKTTSFTVKMSGTFDLVEPSRRKFLEHIAKAGFSDKYIVRDDVSQRIAVELYPLLYEIENALRRYLAKFMCVKVGGGWFNATVNKTVRDSIGDRKKIETPFTHDLHSCEVHLLDFKDLGEVVYGKGGGALQFENLLTQIETMQPDPAAINDIKRRIESNYTKYFSDTLKKENFESLWGQWIPLRDRVAHTRFFELKDLANGKKVASGLTALIAKANAAIAAFTLDEISKTDLQEQAASDGADIDQSQPVSASLVGTAAFAIGATAHPTSASSALEDKHLRDAILEELNTQLELMSNRPGGFVGYKRFVDYTLAEKGFDDGLARDLIRALISEQQIEVFHVMNPYNPEHETAALRLVEASN